MINIMIVEDSEYKLTTIQKLLVEDLMIDAEYISVAKDIKSAKMLLTKRVYDLLILDLVLPLEYGDEPSPEKGVGFLKDINSNPNLNSPIHVIGLTEFSELKPKFDENFHTNLWHLIYYDASETEWQEKLKNFTHHLLSTRKIFLESNCNDGDFDVAIISALSTPEFDNILKISDSWEVKKVINDATKYYTTEITATTGRIRIIAACLDQMGMTASANLCTKICLRFKPKYIFMTGICAGLKDNGLNFGDILIAEQSWDYGSGKMREDSEGDILFEPDPRPIQLCPELKAKMNAFLRRSDVLMKIQQDWKSSKPKFPLQAKLGPIASGSYVIASNTILGDIKNTQRKLLGVEMEGYGVYYSADNSPKQYTKPIMIKSVSDYGDASKNDGYQEYAAFTSAQFAYRFIIEELFSA